MDHVFADPLALLLCLSNGSVWVWRHNSYCFCSFSLRWHQKGCRVHSKGLGPVPISTCPGPPTWTFPPFSKLSLLCSSGWAGSEQEMLGKEKLLAALEMAQTSTWRSCVSAVHWKKERGSTHLKASQRPPPLTGLMLLSLAHCTIEAKHHRPSSQIFHHQCGPPVPGSHRSLSATLLLKSLCSPSPEEEEVSSKVQAWTYVERWEEIFEPATQSTPSAAGKPWAKSDHCSDLQCLEGQRAGLDWALPSSLSILARSALHLCSQPRVMCVSDGEH